MPIRIAHYLVEEYRVCVRRETQVVRPAYGKYRFAEVTRSLCNDVSEVDE